MSVDEIGGGDRASTEVLGTVESPVWASVGVEVLLEAGAFAYKRSFMWWTRTSSGKEGSGVPARLQSTVPNLLHPEYSVDT